MRKLLFLLVLLSAPALLKAQSTSVTLQVTDSGSQTWNLGVYTITLRNATNTKPPTWTGGALTTSFTGTLNGTGGLSISLPSNIAISPAGSTWLFQICPATNPAPCYTSAQSLTSGSQTINLTPPAIVIPPGANNSVYATSEVGQAFIGAQIYVIGTGLQTCSAVSGGFCTSWVGANTTSGAVATACGGVVNALLEGGVTCTASSVIDNGSTVATPEPVASTSDGVHSGLLSLIGNTTAPAIPSNTFNIFGPNLATFTAYALQASPTPPSVISYVQAGVPSSSLSQLSYPSPAFASQTDGATVTWAIGGALVANASLTFTTHGGSRTLNITNPVNGGSYVLWLKQDGTGGEGLTLGTGCTWRVSGGGAGAITPSTGANVVDVLAFTYDGTNCYANFNKNFN